MKTTTGRWFLLTAMAITFFGFLRWAEFDFSLFVLPIVQEFCYFAKHDIPPTPNFSTDNFAQYMSYTSCVVLLGFGHLAMLFLALQGLRKLWLMTEYRER